MFLLDLGFPIDFQSFHEYLVSNVPHADGLCTAHSDAGELGYMVIEKTTFDETDIANVTSYYNSLTQSGEATKMQPTLAERINESISEAAAFGVKLSTEYATSNVLQGITIAGHTQMVADYLKDLAYYLHNGSLYAAIAEMNTMIADTSDAKAALTPYVTNNLLYLYLNKIQTYLQIALTPNPGS